MSAEHAFLGDWVPGVLNKEQLRQLLGDYLRGMETDDFDKFCDASSIDLRISAEGYRMIQGSIKPCGKPFKRSFLENASFSERLNPQADGSFHLDRNQCYIFRLKENFNAKIYGSHIHGQATAKSSVGRMDVIARLVIDGQHQYDYFDSAQKHSSSGDMFLEIIPISFDVSVKEGIALTQLRLFYGEIDNSVVSDEGFIKAVLLGSDDGEGYLSVDLTNCRINGKDVCAFRAKIMEKESKYLPLWQNGTDKPDPCHYWEWKLSNDNRLKIEKNRFYLLRSKEKIALPADVAVYARAMDESLGEMRIHYAGFAHPYFGCQRKDGAKGTPLIFEVRGHNIDVNLGHGEKLAKLIFYRMSKSASKPSPTAYDDQELQLSKYFGKWPEAPEIDENGDISEKGAKK